MMRMLVVIALVAAGQPAPDSTTHAKPRGAPVARSTAVIRVNTAPRFRNDAAARAAYKRFRAAAAMKGPRKVAAAPKGNVRNLLLTPEDRKRSKVFHPFLTPVRRAQAKVLPLQQPGAGATKVDPPVAHPGKSDASKSAP
jgi:hypothetical protein